MTIAIRPSSVMAGPVPAIHVFPSRRGNDVAGTIDETPDKDVDGRDKPGHDGAGCGDPRRTARPLIRSTASAAFPRNTGRGDSP